MKNQKFRYGFLEAGAKSSPVLINSKLNANNEKNLYIYNLNRDSIIEYQRQIVEPKIRELNPDEINLIEDLVSGYKAASKNFVAKNRKPLFDKSAPKQRKSIENEVTEYAFDGDEMDDDSFLFDDN